MKMEFGVLGPLRLAVDGEDVELDQPMLRRLLAVLLCNANSPVSADALAHALWQAKPPASARKTLQLYVHRLRRKLGDPDRIVHGPAGYRLVVAPDECDADEMRRLVADAHATVDLGRRTALLREALGLWRGVPLAEFADVPAVLTMSDALADRRLAVLAERVDVDLELGRHGDLVAELTEVVARHPLHERLRAQLMLALYRCGRQADALATYQHARELLRDELGVDPGEALSTRYQEVVRADPVLDLPARPSRPRPAQLPAAPRDFSGRVGELGELDAVVARGAGLVTISAIAGAAGVGKTALALQWAHHRRADFPDGQLYVDLRGAATAEPVDAAHALSEFLRALGVPAEQVPQEPQNAAGLYRSLVADRRMLVLLDNAHDVDQVRPLLPGTATTVTVVTSRSRLGGLVAINGAHRLLLAPLSPQESHELLVALLGERRVDAEPEAAAAVAEACGHLPLALRIAAANLLDQPRRRLADFVADLARNRLCALEVADDGQAAVRSVFALSYERLEPSPRRLFRRLGLVPGFDATPEAAAALDATGTAESTRLLELLHDAHLLQSHVDGRYRFHDLIGLYAGERADEEEDPRDRGAALDRLYAWYVGRLAAVDRLLLPYRPMVFAADPAAPFDTALDALAWLDDEKSNLIALVRHATSTGRHDAAWQIPFLMGGFFEHRGAWSLGTRLLRTAVDAVMELGDPDLECPVRVQFSIALVRAGRVAEAVVEQQRCLALARETGNRQREAATLNNLGWMYHELGDDTRALASYEATLPMFTATDDRGYLAITLQNIGDAKSLLGDFPGAVEALERSLAIAREDGLVGQEGDSLVSLGQAHARAHRHREAVEHFRASLAPVSDAGNKMTEGLAHSELGRSLRVIGDTKAAAGHFDIAAQLYHDTDDVHLAVAAHLDVTEVHAATGDLDAARRALEMARQLHFRAPDPVNSRRLAAVAERVGTP
ncbi:AfsR/SARP family transcriptional regulator [Lentzea jiangxiensis]|uniref:DNA-binding transcriptional activator of the SARP family n=1 Tax=Lentzea jiangxiensis TaxID=641025 RepID=A0A1H0JNA3_9PSEU|nr:BTAD domain-containing putative transcriptional regulator [Lentzea jiangxiensis]SDO45216.1 DNA-binding transcriptional activator of the SARP family [Lentzea jiangxiensis]